MFSTSSEQYTCRPSCRVRTTPPTRNMRRCQEMRGWLMRRCSARSLTLTSPTYPSRSRMRRRVGLAKASKWSGSSRFGLGRNIKVALWESNTYRTRYVWARWLNAFRRPPDNSQFVSQGARSERMGLGPPVGAGAGVWLAVGRGPERPGLHAHWRGEGFGYANLGPADGILLG